MIHGFIIVAAYFSNCKSSDTFHLSSFHSFFLYRIFKSVASLGLQLFISAFIIYQIYIDFLLYASALIGI